MEVPPSLYIDRLGPNQVRMIRVQSELQDGKVVCAMTIEDLSSGLGFSALSYTWHNALEYHDWSSGSPVRDDPLMKIYCNGETCWVSHNLFQALDQVRRKRFRRLIWIDALCINQDPDDQTEKTQQIQLMGSIYATALEVLIWLGKEDLRNNSTVAVDLLRVLGDLKPEQRKTVRPDGISDAKVASKVAAIYAADLDYRDCWIALAKFFRRTWFTRAWVIQEVILAKNKIVWCGDLEIKWKALREVSGWLAQSEWKDRFVDSKFLRDLGPDPRLGAAAKIGGTEDDIKAMTEKSKGEHEQHDLFLDTLIRAREFDCQEARDKVYCCYGIGLRCWPKDFHFPEPDYSKSLGQAYTQTARAVLEMSNNLHILAYSESLRSAALQAEGKAVPSWVPDWSVKDKVGLGITGYRRYWAGDNLLQRIEFADREQLVLRLRVTQVGTVAAIGNTKQQLRECSNLDATAELLRPMPDMYPTLDEPTRPDKMSGTEDSRQDLTEAFWRTIMFNTGWGKTCPANSAMSNAFRSWMQLKPGGDIIFGALDRSSAVAGTLRAFEQLKLASCTLEADIREFDTAFSLRVCLRVFRTAGGLLGCGAEAILPGDSVFIVPGSRVPLILRKQEGSARYRLVGAAYVHGLMHGQIMSKSPAVNFQTVIELE
ncbi:uncharacterized protein MYCGRDRAFT_96851 [Zymoseptoria tritici IPO323]|uniref:Heterokaryon incompatibility domain-containing protein n=1 Tax=Zymoseptoria tritici (strain CBS 115943 / IPO323) TaxID=336722 RepID=F9XMB4_ZYMTI|nr:uncharacterized protein MYCGRDRAFT_96851 [Zymoseptoria tritici IPO323]EGP83473.1 hypothetical protein MYCGRDRAFT_96851 [Zymoseptoria tritici IPO323]